MKLLALSADRSSFQTLRFHPSGITLILGDGEHTSSQQEGSSNGVGKTLALRLVHHCLGGKDPPAVVARDTPDWKFFLDVSVDGSSHRIERSGDGTLLALDGKAIKIAGLRSWLNHHGGFNIPQDRPYTFRSLISRFARADARDCIDPLATYRETASEALQRTLFLLGANDRMALRKEELKNSLDKFKNELQLLKKAPSIRDIFTGGHNPAARLRTLRDQIDTLTGESERSVIAENFRDMEEETFRLTRVIQDNNSLADLKNFQLQGVLESKSRQRDISKDDLLALYEGMAQIFRPEALRHLDEVDAFQQALISNRTERLTADEERIRLDLTAVETLTKSAVEERNKLILEMNGKQSFDQYVELNQRLLELKEERNRLEKFLQIEKDLLNRSQEVKSSLASEDAKALAYALTSPLETLDTQFRTLARSLFPEATAGIDLANNDGLNKLRFDLSVLIQGQESDGIGNARILCFDWLLLTSGLQHELKFLWHDNRLFADLDPKPRAAWFRAMLHAPELIDRQYIATLNSENFTSMIEHLTNDEATSLSERVAIVLRGDQDSHRLLGIRVG